MMNKVVPLGYELWGVFTAIQYTLVLPIRLDRRVRLTMLY